MSGEETPPTGPVRYTIRLSMMPSGRMTELVVATSAGELKAVAMAIQRLDQEARETEQIHDVQIVRVEHDFTIDANRDILDYWEIA